MQTFPSSNCCLIRAATRVFILVENELILRLGNEKRGCLVRIYQSPDFYDMTIFHSSKNVQYTLSVDTAAGTRLVRRKAFVFISFTISFDVAYEIDKF
jgi:hypothetical protein